MKEKTDIFLWANTIDGLKNELQIELFLFNKNYTPYSIRVADALSYQLLPIFLYDVMNFVNMGAGTGLSVQDLEIIDGHNSVLPHTDLAKVGRAETLLHYIENERKDINEFSQGEHEFKRMKGVVARFTHPTNKDMKFHVVKLLRASDSISTGTAWQINNGKFEPLSSDVTLKIPLDNQVLITNCDIFIFNATKFTQLFEYDVQQIKLSDEKGAAISQKYKLSLPDLFNDLAVMARGRKSTLKKLLEVNTDALIDQETVIETADGMQIELMVDEAGSIILFSNDDLGIFLDILNDNYLSGTTGKHYLAKSKKALEESEQ